MGSIDLLIGSEGPEELLHRAVIIVTSHLRLLFLAEALIGTPQQIKVSSLGFLMSNREESIYGIMAFCHSTICIPFRLLRSGTSFTLRFRTRFSLCLLLAEIAIRVRGLIRFLLFAHMTEEITLARRILR